MNKNRRSQGHPKIGLDTPLGRKSSFSEQRIGSQLTKLLVGSIMTITNTSIHNKRSSFLTSTFLAVASVVVGWTPMEVLGMDVVANKDGWRCESRPIKASLQYLCSQHNSCTLNNEQALIEGECTCIAQQTEPVAHIYVWSC